MQRFIQHIEQRLLWLYPLLALVLYWPTRHAGFVHDFTGWYERYQEYGFSGISHCFGYHRLQHVMHTLHFLIYKLFDTSPLPWYIIYSVLFGFVTFGVYWLGKLLLQFIGLEKDSFPLIASFLFLIHPFHTTTVVWKVCFHYLLATLFVILVVGYMLKWITDPERKKIVLIYILYLLSLFTHELTVAIPLISIIILLFLLVRRHPMVKKVLFWLVIPQFIILPLYFSSTSILLSDTGKAPLMSEHQINPQKQLSAVLRYAAKHSLLTRYWSHPAKEKLYFSLEKPIVLVSALLIGLILVALFFFYYRKLPGLIQLFGLCILCFMAAIGPFTSAYESYLLYSTNDMYGFSASVFLLLGLVAFIRWLPRRISRVILIVYATISFIFLIQTNYYWHESGHVMNSLLEDFRWHDKEHVYVLISPDNFKGILMMKSHEKSMLDDHLLVKNKHPPQCEIEDIIQFNMKSRHDGVQVIVHSQDSLSVKFNQWGTWHWRNGIGASSYENDKFNVQLAIPYYHLKRKIKEQNSVFIYQIGDKWEEVTSWSSQ